MWEVATKGPKEKLLQLTWQATCWLSGTTSSLLQPGARVTWVSSDHYLSREPVMCLWGHRGILSKTSREKQKWMFTGMKWALATRQGAGLGVCRTGYGWRSGSATFWTWTYFPSPDLHFLVWNTWQWTKNSPKFSFISTTNNSGSSSAWLARKNDEKMEHLIMTLLSASKRCFVAMFPLHYLFFLLSC